MYTWLFFLWNFQDVLTMSQLHPLWIQQSWICNVSISLPCVWVWVCEQLSWNSSLISGMSKFNRCFGHLEFLLLLQLNSHSLEFPVRNKFFWLLWHRIHALYYTADTEGVKTMSTPVLQYIEQLYCWTNAFRLKKH